MAKATEVSSSTPTKTLDTKHDTTSPSVEHKNAPLTRFMTKLKGESKMYFQSLLKQYLVVMTFLKRRKKVKEIMSMKFPLLMLLLRKSMN